MEIWKDVLGYEGYYQVSNLGRVTSTTRKVLGRAKSSRTILGRLKKPALLKNGRLSVILHKDGKYQSFYVHRLVLTAFRGPCPEDMQACHFPDKNPLNNKLSNLRWDTAKANRQDMVYHDTRLYGESSHMSKLTESNVLQIRDRLSKGDKQTHIAEDFGVCPAVIIDIRKGTTWSHIKSNHDVGQAQRGTKGSENGNAKLDEVAVKKIRMLYFKKQYNQSELSQIFEVSVMTILRIINRQSWKHVT